MVATTSSGSSNKSVTVARRTSVSKTPAGIRWDKKMSNNCATSLLVYTLLQIFVVLQAVETKGMSIAPYFGLVLLVAVIIPFCRKYEKRWQEMMDSGLTDQSLAAKYRTDQITLWALTLGLPAVFWVIIKLIGAVV